MKNLFLSMLAMVAMVSCTNEIVDNGEKVDNGQPQAIKFGSSILGVQTKAIADDATSFGTDEKISVYGYRGVNVPTKDETPFMENVTYTSGSNGAFSTTDNTALWQRGEKHHFYALYPSTLVVTKGTDVAPTVAITVVENTGIADDIMYASLAGESGITFNNEFTAANLAFSHKLSKVKFLIKKSNGVPASTLTELSFTATENAGSLNLLTGVITPTTADVTLLKTISGGTEIITNGINVDNFAPMLLPTSTLKNLSLVINEQSLSVTDLTATLEAGKVTTITITVNAKGVSFTSSIAPWGSNDGSGSVE